MLRVLAFAVAVVFAVLFVYGMLESVSPWHAGMFVRGCVVVWVWRTLHRLATDHEPRRNASE